MARATCPRPMLDRGDQSGRTALGIDVGERKGMDLVLMAEGPRVLHAQRVATADVAFLIDSWKPKVVAIDSPPGFPTRGPRKTEVELRRHGLSLFATPWDPRKQVNAFYNWMREGFKVYHIARESGFDLYAGGKSVGGKAIEVFPFASAAALTGSGRPRDKSKSAWRREVLAKRGVDTSPLRGIDQVDAALAAYTGLSALDGCFCWLGEVSEGVIVLPCNNQDLLPLYTRPARDIDG